MTSVEEIAWSRSSPMPEGLLDSFTKQDILDLLEFLLRTEAGAGAGERAIGIGGTGPKERPVRCAGIEAGDASCEPRCRIDRSSREVTSPAPCEPVCLSPGIRDQLPPLLLRCRRTNVR